MKRFIVLYNAPREAMRAMMANTSPEEQKKSMDAWKTWMGQNMSSFVDTGAPAGKNLRVTKENTEAVSNDVGGYSIMQADSKEALVMLLQSGPHLGMPGSYVEVMELMEMPS